MASIVITINTDGAAFQCHEQLGTHRLARNWEMARILRVIADDFERYVAGDWTNSVRLPRSFDGKPCGKIEMIE